MGTPLKIHNDTYDKICGRERSGSISRLCLILGIMIAEKRLVDHSGVLAKS